MHNRITWAIGLAAALSLGACANSPKAGGPANPDHTVDNLTELYAMTPDDARYDVQRIGGKKRGKKAKGISRAGLRKRAETLSFLYPSHVPARLMAGVLAYEFKDPTRAAQHLDHVLHLEGSHPSAAMLRSRIALEGGNHQYATRMLDEQVGLRPDHPGLREAQASAWFLAGNTVKAVRALDAAERLGSPAWRTAYNRGLLAETAGDMDGALGFYQQANAAAPHHDASRQRLKALASGTGIEAAHWEGSADEVPEIRIEYVDVDEADIGLIPDPTLSVNDAADEFVDAPPVAAPAMAGGELATTAPMHEATMPPAMEASVAIDASGEAFEALAPVNVAVDMPEDAPLDEPIEVSDPAPAEQPAPAREPEADEGSGMTAFEMPAFEGGPLDLPPTDEPIVISKIDLGLPASETPDEAPPMPVAASAPAAATPAVSNASPVKATVRTEPKES